MLQLNARLCFENLVQLKMKMTKSGSGWFEKLIYFERVFQRSCLQIQYLWILSFEFCKSLIRFRIFVFVLFEELSLEKMLNLNNLESDPNVNKLNLRIRWCQICWRLCTHSQKSIMTATAFLFICCNCKFFKLEDYNIYI